MNYLLLSFRLRPWYTCPECATVQPPKLKESMNTASVRVLQTSVSASPVQHDETTPKKRKRTCIDCSETCFKGDWCSTYHWDSNTGYCSSCAMICSTCKPSGTLRKKNEYDETHWNNVKWYPDRQPSCVICQEAKQTEKFQCARCIVNGEKQWFGKEHFHPGDLKDRKKRKRLDKLQCRQP